MRSHFYYFLILLLLSGCSKNPTSSDSEAPLPGSSGNITISDIQYDAFTISWAAATDDETNQEDLEYKLLRSNTANIDTLESCEANGTVVMDWTANTVSSTDSGLSIGTRYYYNVLVRDEADNRALYTCRTVLTLWDERIVFYSDRDGSGKIYLMNPDGTALTMVTQGDHTDTEPSLATDGTIAFSRGGYIFTMASDGSNAQRPTFYSSPGYDHCAAWSPDVSQILFNTGLGTDAEIFLMDRDGSGLTNITNAPGMDRFPAWSPDGTRISFTGTREGITGIYIMKLDGSGLVRVTSSYDGSADWSPDGTRIAFSRVYSGDRQIHIINIDGTGLIRLDTQGDCWGPTWSPDGNKIAFSRNLNEERDIVVIFADGSGETVLTEAGSIEGSPDWERIPRSSANHPPVP